MLPTLLFAMLISITLFGCDSGGNAGSASSGLPSQPTTASNSSATSSDNRATITPDANSASGNQPTPAVSGAGDIKLVVTKYNVVPRPNVGGVTSYFGIVKNEGNAPVYQIIINLVDDSGTAVESAVASYLDYTILAAGQSAGFGILYMGDDIKHPQFKATADPVASSNLQPAQLSVVSHQASVGAAGLTNVTGEVRNDSDHRASEWIVNVIGYDDSGNIVGVGDGNGTNGNADPLAAHSNVQFLVRLHPPNIKPAKYDLYASGFQNPLP
ncbi:MAG: hypothetical protein DLM69_11455 [Candidatus Chloroheliales bacterium]|nr:MAG: hypothetical protein DLM69_11455 [Chloroflexota bacterium]